MVSEKSFELSDRSKISFERARKFMQNNRRPDGLWSDFLTLAGESVCWVSGYIGYAIVSSNREYGDERWLHEVGSYILAQQNLDGGWGYGPKVPSDADSTSWCLLFLSRLGTKSPQNKDNALTFLLRHQSHVDGGYRTYSMPREIGNYMMIDQNISFEGWASSQMCVTAVAARALVENKSNIGVEEALDYIRRGQAAEGYWNSYWWSGRLYATVNCLEALKAKGNDDDVILLKKTQEWIAKTQLSDGGWSDSSTQNESWPFSTALALKGLMVLPNSNFLDAVNKGVEWLINNQLNDGSWSSNYILRIPHPSVKEPWNQPYWKMGGKAINAVIKDHRRLYTTATIYSALSEYENRLQG